MRPLATSAVESIQNLLSSVASTAAWQPVADWLVKLAAVGAPGTAAAAGAPIVIPLAIAGGAIAAQIGLGHSKAKKSEEEQRDAESARRFLEHTITVVSSKLDEIDFDIQLNFQNEHVRFTQLEEMIKASQSSTEGLREYFEANEGLFISLERFLLDSFDEVKGKIDGVDAHVAEIGNDLVSRLSATGQDVQETRKLVAWLVHREIDRSTHATPAEDRNGGLSDDETELLLYAYVNQTPLRIYQDDMHMPGVRAIFHMFGFEYSSTAIELSRLDDWPKVNKPEFHFNRLRWLDVLQSIVDQRLLDPMPRDEGEKWWDLSKQGVAKAKGILEWRRANAPDTVPTPFAFEQYFASDNRREP